jgi:hypothetical protein
MLSETRTRPPVVSVCKTCAGPRNLAPLPAQEAISPRGVVHYGMNDGDTLCGKNATGPGWWWPV